MAEKIEKTGEQGGTNYEKLLEGTEVYKFFEGRGEQGEEILEDLRRGSFYSARKKIEEWKDITQENIDSKDPRFAGKKEANIENFRRLNSYIDELQGVEDKAEAMGIGNNIAERVVAESGPVVVEKEASPWERAQTQDEQKMIDKYYKAAELSKESKEYVGQTLTQEGDQARIDFAREWFENNKDKTEEKGFNTENVDEGYMVRVASEMGGFEDLKKEGEWKNRIDNIYALKADFQKGNPSLESQYLTLNLLGKKAERLEEELKVAKDSKNEQIINAKTAELKKLFEVRKELTEKATGRNLTKEAAEETGKEMERLQLDGTLDEQKKKYTEENSWSRLEKKMDDKRGELIKGKNGQGIFSEYDYLEELGYSLETVEKGKKRIGWRGFALRKGKAEVVNILDKNSEPIKGGEGLLDHEARAVLEIETEKKMKSDIEKELGKEWGDIVEEKKKEYIKKIIESSVRNAGSSLENVEGGIETVYERLKDKLITEFIEKDLKKDEKSKEALAAIEKIAKGKGKNWPEILNKIIHRKGKLSELTGNWEEDLEGIDDFLEECGINISQEDLGKYATAMKVRGKTYRAEFGKQKGLVEWVLGAVSESLKPKKPLGQRKTK